MPQTTEMPRLGRCKDCDFALFVANPSDAIEAEGWNDIKPDGRAYRKGNDGFFARCPQRHRFFVLKQIKGTYSKDHKCDARCLNARGHNCTCSCGGLNHGRGFAVTAVTEATTTSVDLTPMATDKQLAFIRKLLDERVMPPRYTAAGECEMTSEDRRERGIEMVEQREFTKSSASDTITYLLDKCEVRNE